MFCYLFINFISFCFKGTALIEQRRKRQLVFKKIKQKRNRKSGREGCIVTKCMVLSSVKAQISVVLLLVRMLVTESPD